MQNSTELVLDKHPLTLRMSATVAYACKRMRHDRSTLALVTDISGNLVGVFTDSDVARRVVADGKDPNTTLLAEVMTANPRTMSFDTPASVALQQLRDGGLRRIPVVQNERILGLTSYDEIRRWARVGSEAEPGGAVGFVQQFANPRRAVPPQRSKADDARERFELALRSLSVGVWDWDLEERSLYWSPKYKEMLGIRDPDFWPDARPAVFRDVRHTREGALDAIARISRRVG